MRHELAFRTRPCRGESSNGDAVIVRRRHDALLVVVVDALGHGDVAAEVAQRARDQVERRPWPRSARQVVEGLHEALHGTRGAAAAVLWVEGDRALACSVNNVEVRSLLGCLRVLSSPGVLGRRLRSVRESEGRLRAGERIAIFTDGLDASVSLIPDSRSAVDDACDALMQRHAFEHDDASLVLIDCDRVSA